ncbi:MAG: hypothetical protein JW915_18075 [Chitinispirillaceae bacterium]|nr:hypothetical protein [Chitinispirillaceae bacterium]
MKSLSKKSNGKVFPKRTPGSPTSINKHFKDLTNFPFLTGRSGSALPLVIFFSSIGLIIVLSYISRQLMITKPSVSSRTSIQALFNARSGIYKAFDIITNGTSSDTLKTIGATDWGEDLFDTLSDDPEDPFSEIPAELDIYSNDSFGNCEITLIPYGSFYELKSAGLYRDCKRTITARLGGKIPALPDTVLIITNALPWEGSDPRGTVVNDPVQDSASDSKALTELLSDYNEALMFFDSLTPEAPLNVFGSRDLYKIKDTINSDLTIDGRTSKCTWNASRTLYINGKLTLIGDVKLDQVRFVVADDIIFSEGASIKNSSVYTSRGLFIENNSQFSGDAIALHSISVYDEATVINKSSLVVAGTSSAVSKDSSSAGKKDSLRYSVYIENRAVVDGVIIALGQPGSVKSGPETEITGIILAKNHVCHQGQMQGCIKAGRMIDCSVPDGSNLEALVPGQTKQTQTQPVGYNTMTGSIRPLETISQYKVPCFTNDLAIIEWIEQ